jgi:NAD(P)-dependent dehydrogenase (short-subunit alcohol dehydrogenase family)
MVGRLDGRVAFVTAAGGAIAGAIARLFAAEGAKVWCVDIREETVAKTVSDIEALSPGHGAACIADVSEEASVRKAVDDAVARFGKIDVVVNAAAASEAVGDIVEMPFADWQRVLNVNLSSVFLVCKYAAPHLRDAGGGSIINIGSTFGRVVVPRRPGYTTTKAAVIQLSKSMAIDLAHWNIRVNSISPGAIETARLLDRHPNMDAVRERFVPKHPIGRLGRPEEVAQAALYLATEASSFVTASDLLVDGGYTAI